jgi:hypothetical protein
MKNDQALIKAGKVTKVLSAAALLLVIASSGSLLVGYLTGYSSVFVHKVMKLFYLDLELNVPAFFSALILLMAAALLSAIFYLRMSASEKGTAYWAVLAAGFTFMAFDEVAALHERMIEPMRAMLGEHDLGALYFAWVVPAGVVVLFLGIYFLKFLWNLPASTRNYFVIAGFIFLGGAFGLELFEGKHAELYGKEDLIYYTLVTCEEAMEMLGVMVFIHGLINYISEQFGSINFTFAGSSLVDGSIASNLIQPNSDRSPLTVVRSHTARKLAA